MFWSKTKDVVHSYASRNKDCFVTMENTLLGSVLDGLTWCGKEGSNGKAEQNLPPQSSSSRRDHSSWMLCRLYRACSNATPFRWQSRPRRRLRHSYGCHEQPLDTVRKLPPAKFEW